MEPWLVVGIVLISICLFFNRLGNKIKNGYWIFPNKPYKIIYTNKNKA